jgi:hypothetical protein
MGLYQSHITELGMEGNSFTVIYPWSAFVSRLKVRHSSKVKLTHRIDEKVNHREVSRLLELISIMKIGPILFFSFSLSLSLPLDF